MASILEPLSGAQQDELVAAMRTVERLITTSLVELRQVDPEMPDAQRCLRAYVAELNRRAPQRGFDPGKGATAKSHEVRPPNGAFVIADLRGEAIGCGAVKHQPGNVTDIKRMWLAESARDLGSVAASLSTSSTSRANTVRAKRTAKPATCCQKRSRSTGRRGTSRYRHSNDEPFADRWFAKSLG